VGFKQRARVLTSRVQILVWYWENSQCEGWLVQTAILVVHVTLNKCGTTGKDYRVRLEHDIQHIYTSWKAVLIINSSMYYILLLCLQYNNASILKSKAQSWYCWTDSRNFLRREPTLRSCLQGVDPILRDSDWANWWTLHRLGCFSDMIQIFMVLCMHIWDWQYLILTCQYSPPPILWKCSRLHWT
jgi:hypothetical protein